MESNAPKYPELAVSMLTVFSNLKLLEGAYTSMCELEDVTDEQMVSMWLMDSRINKIKEWLSTRAIELLIKEESTHKELASVLYEKENLRSVTKCMPYASWVYEEVKEQHWNTAREVLKDLYFDMDISDYSLLVSFHNAQEDILKSIRRGYMTEEGSIYL